MWPSERKPRYAKVEINSAVSARPIIPAHPERYSFFDSVLYVGLLCIAGTIVSFAAKLPLERVLGINFVTGWFSLDLVWAEHNHFVRMKDDATAVLSFAGGIVAAVGLWWAWQDQDPFLYANGAAAVILAVYWMLSEECADDIMSRGCVKALLLYGVATALGLLVCLVQDITFVVHPWYVAFVLNALAVQRRTPTWWTRALHGYTWGTLIYELGKDELVFSKYFYV